MFRRLLLISTISLLLQPIGARASDFFDGRANADQIANAYKVQSVLIVGDKRAKWYQTSQDAFKYFKDRGITAYQAEINAGDTGSEFLTLAKNVDNFNQTVIYCLCYDEDAQRLANFVKTIGSDAVIVGTELSPIQ